MQAETETILKWMINVCKHLTFGTRKNNFVDLEKYAHTHIHT